MFSMSVFNFSPRSPEKSASLFFYSSQDKQITIKSITQLANYD